MGIELSNIRKVRARRRLVICYPGSGIYFIRDKGIALHVRGNSIRNRDGTFERTNITEI